MFRITDQAVMDITIDGRDILGDFADLRVLSVIERAGTELPTLGIGFRTIDTDLIYRINEGNPVVVSMGSDNDDLLDSEFLFQNPRFDHAGAGSWLIQSYAILSTLPKWAKPEVFTSKKISGIERIRDVAGRVDRIDRASISKSNDSQNWVQYGCPNKLHVDDIWMHCDLGDSFPMLAYTLDGFRIRDALELFEDKNGSPDWILTNSNLTGKRGELLYTEHLGLTQHNGFLNSIGGRGTDQPIFDIDRGAGSMHSTSPFAGLAVTGDLNVSDDFTNVHNAREVLTRNMHSKYWESYAHNKTQLSLYSTCRIAVTLTGYYAPIHPLDIVILRDFDVSQDGRDLQQARAHTGYYIVSRVSYVVENNSFAMEIELVRESINRNLM